MITAEDMTAMAPETRVLDLDRKDWREHLDKVVRLADVGTRIVYWIGPSDWKPQGNRKEVFEAMMAYSDAGKVHLYQRSVGGGVRKYIAEVR